MGGSIGHASHGYERNTVSEAYLRHGRALHIHRNRIVPCHDAVTIGVVYELLARRHSAEMNRSLERLRNRARCNKQLLIRGENAAGIERIRIDEHHLCIHVVMRERRAHRDVEHIERRVHAALPALITQETP